jgi:Tfp pilus assembly protein PilF
MAENNKPAAKISIYPVHATIWRNGKFYSVKFERSYKDEGQWKRTTSFDHQNLLALSKVADQAHTEIERLRAEDYREANAENNLETADQPEGE